MVIPDTVRLHAIQGTVAIGLPVTIGIPHDPDIPPRGDQYREETTRHRSPWTMLVTQTPPSATLSRRTCRFCAARPPGAGHRGHGCRLGALAASVLGVVVLAVAACGSGRAAVSPVVAQRSPRVCHSVAPPPGVSRSAQTLYCNDGVTIISRGVTVQTGNLSAVAIAGRVPVPGFARCLARHGATATIPGGPGKHKLPPAQAAAFTACSTPIRPPTASPPLGR
jgi:hypothetical protein